VLGVNFIIFVHILSILGNGSRAKLDDEKVLSTSTKGSHDAYACTN